MNEHHVMFARWLEGVRHAASVILDQSPTSLGENNCLIQGHIYIGITFSTAEPDHQLDILITWGTGHPCFVTALATLTFELGNVCHLTLRMLIHGKE